MYDMKSVKELLDVQKKLNEKLCSMRSEFEILKYDNKGLLVENEKLKNKLDDLKKLLSAPPL